MCPGTKCFGFCVLGVFSVRVGIDLQWVLRRGHVIIVSLCLRDTLLDTLFIVSAHERFGRAEDFRKI